MVNCAVDRRRLRERDGRIKYMKGEAKRFAVQALRKDDALGGRVEVRLEERDGAHAVRAVGWATSHGDDPRTICEKGRSREFGGMHAMRERVPSSATNNIAETEMYSGSAGGGVAIMFAPYPRAAKGLPISE